MFKGIPIPTYAWKKIGDNLILIDYNDAGEKQSTSKIKDFIGIKASELYKNQPEFLKNLHKCVEDKINIKEDLKYKFSTTEKEGYFHITYGFVPPDLVIVHTEDISERVQMEEKLKESEEKYRLISENANDMIAVLNDRFEYEYINEQIFMKVLGYSKEDLIGKINLPIIHPDDLKRTIIASSKILRKSRGTHQVRFRHRDGNYKWLEVTARNFFNSKGEKKIINIYRDITERKKAEDELEQKMREMKTFINNIPHMAWLKDLDSNFILANKSFGDAVGMDPEYLRNHTCAICFGEEAAKKFKEDDRVVIEGKKQIILEESIVDMERKKVYLETTKSPIFNDAGYVVGTVGIAIDITERKKLEEKLKESEEKFRSLVETTSDWIWEIDQNTIYKYSSPKVKDLLGYEPKEIIGKTPFELMPVDEAKRVEILFQDIKKSQDSFNSLENINLSKDGQYITLETSGVPIFDTHGNLIGYRGIDRDITERKKVEEELIESHHFIQKITESTPGVIYIYDLLKEKNVYASKGLNNVLGYTPEEFKAMGDTVLGRLIHANDLGPFMEYLEMLKKIKDDKIYEYEYRMKHKDGHWVWILNRDMIFSRDSKGMPLQTIGVASDITEHKKAEQKLKKSEDRYKNESDNLMNILNTMEEGVVLINRQYDVEFVNPVFINEFGSYEGKKCYNYFHDRKEICSICRNKDVFTEKTVRREWYSKKTQKTYDLISTPLKSPDGSVSILDIFHDITIRKRVEQKLKDISRLKSELLRRVSHELKTPLVSIKGNADLLLKLHYDRLESDTISVVQDIKEGCERLEDLIKDLLESSQLESGQVKLKPAREDLAFLIKFCVRELEGLAKIRNHKIEVEIHDKLNTVFEKEKIYEVVNNLLSNAIKYTPPNGTIKIKSEIKDDFYVISVEDNGIGFTEKEKEQLFKQFGKIERYGQGWDLGIEGSGLGLYISKQIVELHGGKIWVESLGRNKGSTFYFSLPIVKD